MPGLSSRLSNFEPSRIAEIFSLATRLKEQGEDIADLSSGEPDFATDARVCEAAKAAIDRGMTRYTPTDGTTELKRAVQTKFRVDNELDYSLSEIVVDAGAKPLIAHALLAILDQGDEVIIPTPCWASHPGAVKLCGGSPVFVRAPAENGFKIGAPDLQQAITGKTKAIIFNSPSNPTGAVYSPVQLKALTDVLKQHPELWVVTDDIYEKLRYDDRVFATVAQVEPSLKNRTITINGVSKAYAMTGWRIGYAGGPQPLMDAIRDIMSQATGNPCSVSQVAAVAALNADQDYMASHVETYQARRDKVVDLLNTARGLSVKPCEGAFYLYVNCGGVLGKITKNGEQLQSSADFACYLLEKWKVAVVPGSAFEYDPYFRLSFATSDEVLDKACDRIIQGCLALA